MIRYFFAWAWLTWILIVVDGFTKTMEGWFGNAEPPDPV